MKRRALAIAWAAAATAGACQPELGPSDGLVTRPVILAVKAEPPEAAAGATATVTALVALADGSHEAAPVVWRFCTAPKPLTTDDAVAPGCLDAASLVGAGTGSPTVAATPANACAVFGPETAAADARPRDPDGTGGYYQPLRADVPGADPAFYLARLLCGLGSAPADTVAAFAQQYVPNSNPHLGSVSATVDGAPASLSRISPGASVTLHVGWAAGDAETYAYYEPASQELSIRRESMRVSWHASAGEFASESTGRDEADLGTSTDDRWTAPGRAGAATLWIVLRDSRGGTDFATYAVTLTP